MTQKKTRTGGNRKRANKIYYTGIIPETEGKVK